MTTQACPPFCVIHEDDGSTWAHVGEVRMLPLRDPGIGSESLIAAVFAVQRVGVDDGPRLVVDLAGVSARLSLPEAFDFVAVLDEAILRAAGHTVNALPAPVRPATWRARPFATFAAVVRAAVRGRCRLCAARLNRYDCAPGGDG